MTYSLVLNRPRTSHKVRIAFCTLHFAVAPREFWMPNSVPTSEAAHVPAVDTAGPVASGLAGSQGAWARTNAVSIQVWSATKQASAFTWGHTKNASAAAWDHTKSASEASWQHTKVLSSKAVAWTSSTGREIVSSGGADPNVVSTVSGATAGVAGATAAGPIAGFVANFAGFGALGVKAGSVAAGMMGPSTAAGSLTAVLQSIGATGTLGYLGTAATVGVTGAVGVTAGLGTAAVVKAVYRKPETSSEDVDGTADVVALELKSKL